MIWKFISSSKQKEYNHRIPRTRITFSSNLYLKQTILVFGPNLIKKSIPGLKQKKRTKTIEFSTSKLVLPNFSLNRQFGSNLKKKRVYQNEKNEHQNRTEHI